MTTKAATKNTGLRFPFIVSPATLKEIALTTGTYTEVIELDYERELEHRELHSQAVQLRNNVFQTSRDISELVKQHYAISVTDDDKLTRTKKLLKRQIDGTDFVEAPYFELKFSEVLDLLTAANKALLMTAISGYIPNYGLKELKVICNELEKEIIDGQYEQQHSKAFLVTSKDYQIAAWYTYDGFLIEEIDFDASMDGQSFSNAGTSILETL